MNKTYPIQETLFRCPITQAEFIKPVITACGHVFEEKALLNHIEVCLNSSYKQIKCPACKEILVEASSKRDLSRKAQRLTFPTVHLIRRMMDGALGVNIDPDDNNPSPNNNNNRKRNVVDIDSDSDFEPLSKNVKSSEVIDLEEDCSTSRNTENIDTKTCELKPPTFQEQPFTRTLVQSTIETYLVPRVTPSNQAPTTETPIVTRNRLMFPQINSWQEFNDFLKTLTINKNHV